MIAKIFNLKPAFLVLCGCLAWMQAAGAGPYSALVMEVESDRILYSKNADELRHPASLTKMMTLYLLFEALSQEVVSLSDSLQASAFAVSKPPSKLGLRSGDTLSIEESILGLVTQSANDAATVIAESLGGSEPEFAEMMTQKARQLGMNNTVFRNASGLPDPNQVTTARDMYRLAKALLKNFPQYYHYFSTERFWYKNRSFHNHNHLLNSYAGTDGIKTGFVNASGFNLVASARRNGVRLIGVVFGGNTHARRDAHMRTILDDGFAQLEGGVSAVAEAGFEEPTATLLHRPSAIDSEISPGGRKNQRPPPQALNDEDENHAGREARKPSWQVHIGEFGQEKSAEHRLSEAMRTAPYAFRHAKGAVMTHSKRGKKTFIAYFRGLSKEDAALACQFLRRKRMACSSSHSG
ncbi:MAG: D-alanyl-D-alanine carboxypeptidase [Methylococcaceae bacterium]|nr:D-alanyl-D-alanine carboxypeptidase [Methylococcaceae bacterium]